MNGWQKGAWTLVSRLMIGMCLACGIAAPLAAQTGAGSVTGTVEDANHGVVSGAAVRIINTDTAVSVTTTTSAMGSYYFGSLQRGNYTLAVEKEGFKKWEGTLVLQVGQALAVNATLAVGSAATVVEVKDVAPLVNTQSAEIADVKDHARIRQLPLNGREVTLLLNLTPGLEGQGSCEVRSNAGPCSSFRANGLKTGSLDISIDGVSLVDRFGGGSTRVLPGLDTVQEFRVETVGSDARYSRPATVTLTSRSGTNEFHGSIFETHRNNSGGLLARRREDSITPDFPRLIRNEFGASAGGPVLIPGVYDGRKRTFFFGSYEGLRISQRALQIDTVPTAAMWAGDFSGLVDTNDQQFDIYDPTTTDPNTDARLQFPGNIIPADRISAFAKALQPLTALPTSNVSPYLDYNYFHYYPARTSLNGLTFRVDHHFTDNDNVSVRWTRSKRHFEQLGGRFGSPPEGLLVGGTSRQDVNLNNVSVTYNRVIKNNLLNELLVGVQRELNSMGTLADFKNWSATLGLPNPFGALGWPTIYADDYGYNYGYGWDADNNKVQAMTSEAIEDNLTWIKGRHTLQFGGRFRREQNNIRELQQAQGSEDFNGNWTSLADPNDPFSATWGTGDGFADLLLGLPTYLSNRYNRGFFYFRQSEVGLYATDRIKVTPRLTLNLGLRWDHWSPYTEAKNRMTNIDFNTIASLFQVTTPGSADIYSLPGIPTSLLDSYALRGLTYSTANAAGYPGNLFSGVYGDFGPRIGAAFQINEKTVLRGGYGEYFWTMPLSQILQAARNNAPLDLAYSNPFMGPGADGGGSVQNYSLISVPSSGNYLGNAIVSTQGTVTLPGTALPFTAWDGRHWKDGHARAWNVSLERVLPYKTTLRASYIGNHGGSLEQRFSINSRESLYNYVSRTQTAPPSNRDLLRVNPNWNVIGINRTGYSNSHIGQLELEHRFAQGVVFQWFYAYTRSLTTSDSNGFDSGSTSINSGAQGASIPENIQIMGEPNLSVEARRHLIYFNSTEVPAHRVRYNFLVDLPFGRGKRFGRGATGWKDKLIGGWQVATIGSWRSGNWLTINTGQWQQGNPRLSADQRLVMTINGATQRLWFAGNFNPTLASGVDQTALQALVPLVESQRHVHRAGPNCTGGYTGQLAVLYNNGANCFNAPISDMFNPYSRGSIMGPGAWVVDSSIFKNISVKERLNIRLTADFFNVFNHPNDVNPNTTTGLQNLSRQSNDPRIIQFSLRIDW